MVHDPENIIEYFFKKVKEMRNDNFMCKVCNALDICSQITLHTTIFFTRSKR